jgi:hypothetical protein
LDITVFDIIFISPIGAETPFLVISFINLLALETPVDLILGNSLPKIPVAQQTPLGAHLSANLLAKSSQIVPVRWVLCDIHQT